MSEERWAAIDRALERQLIGSDEALEAALEATRAAGMPEIQISALQGRLLQILASSIGARRILEIGTLAGYSTIWMARALPAEGRLVTLELSPRHADVARANLARAGLADRVEVRVGPALESLERMVGAGEAGEAPFDLAFIDADKEPYAEYFDYAVRLARPGALIIADNVVRGGSVALDEDAGESRAEGMRRFNEALARDPRVIATEIQVVGVKGHDGLAFAIVRGG
jgi:caffeoyl-CoA O-methyltransferase